MELKSSSHIYRVGKLVGEADLYRLYLCVQTETGRQCLLQIASTAGQNGGLDRAAYILGELKRRSDELEAEYATVKSDPDRMLNYDLGFPELVDSFVCQEQGGRRVNILAFRCVEEASKMVPLANLTEKDRLRVDLRTSAWIMGKILKLFVLAHSEGISVGLTAGNNFLIEPDNHYVLIFDWSAAQMHPELVPAQTRRQEISQAAQAVVVALGGNTKSGFLPDDDETAFNQYSEFLMMLASGSESNAERAHKKFYEIVDAFWPREFYPFTVKPL